MTKSDWTLSLWVLSACSECSLNACLMLSDSSWSHPEDIMKTSWRHPEGFMKSSWRIWGWKMKIECSRQLCAERTDRQTDRQTDRVTPWAPVGANNLWQNICQSLHLQDSLSGPVIRTESGSSWEDYGRFGRKPGRCPSSFPPGGIRACQGRPWPCPGGGKSEFQQQFGNLTGVAKIRQETQ